jgi:hypothetical protein
MGDFFGQFFFTHTLRYPTKRRIWSWVETGESQQTEEPWRTGKSLVFSVPWKYTARVLGVWVGTADEEAFHNAAGTREIKIPTQRVRGW